MKNFTDYRNRNPIQYLDNGQWHYGEVCRVDGDTIHLCEGLPSYDKSDVVGIPLSIAILKSLGIMEDLKTLPEHRPIYAYGEFKGFWSNGKLRYLPTDKGMNYVHELLNVYEDEMGEPFPFSFVPPF